MRMRVIENEIKREGQTEIVRAGNEEVDSYRQRGCVRGKE